MAFADGPSGEHSLLEVELTPASPPLTAFFGLDDAVTLFSQGLEAWLRTDCVQFLALCVARTDLLSSNSIAHARSLHSYLFDTTGDRKLAPNDVWLDPGPLFQQVKQLIDDASLQELLPEGGSLFNKEVLVFPFSNSQ